jgi:multidrug efflux system outer membrane protein
MPDTHKIKTDINCISEQRYVRIFIFFIFIYFITGCTVGPNYEPPKREMPKEWPQGSSGVFVTSTDVKNSQWWKIFSDNELDKMINRAIQNNYDVKASIYRIEASRALRDYTAGQYYPNINALGSYNRELPSSAFIPGISSKPIDLYTTGFNFLWEIDLFGKIKRSIESSQASYQASIEDYRGVLITMITDVCTNYIDLRTIQERIKFARDNVEIQRKTLELTQNLFKAEIAGELDVKQAEFNLANTESEIPTLLIAEEAAYNSLAVLIGELPGSLRNELSSNAVLIDVNESINISLPADLLRQRPDIRKAERQLASQTALIGVADSDLYPSLQLSGVFETQALKFSGLGNFQNKTYSFGPGFTWNLFEGNRIRNNIKIQKAVTSELLANWQTTVLAAVKDVQNAMYAYVQEKHRRKSRETSVKASLRSVTLVENLYQSGLTDFQNVLNTQRNLFIQQDALVSSKASLLHDIVLIYKAFGSGWQ